MADLISSLPDEIICYILSFLPSQQVVATSVLSKRWNLLWRFVPSLDFDTFNKYFWLLIDSSNKFSSSVCSFLVRRGDQPFYKFRLKGFSSMDVTECMKTQIWTTVSESGRVQILDLYCDWDTEIPSVVFSFKTLVALKLNFITMEYISFVDLPLLKILHLKNIISPIEIDLSHILSGCPNLEELKVKGLISRTIEKFIRLPKLVRASMDDVLLPLNFDFHNLVQIQLNVFPDWLLILKVLNHCPKLQILVICFYKV
ncbi:hypothetical protein V8G54_029824 [Vigna mungo]|uniref:F-box domain-containing protein n=1 Tax=Vigna mungo TaxID=3915 RepID=A0AAQ3MVD5_VIGMU